MTEHNFEQLSEDYRRVAQAIHFIEQNVERQPSLEEIAAHVNLSPYHFHRLFRRWAGVTPKQFLQFLTIDYAKNMLAESQSVLETSLAVGMSGPGRLHDLFVTIEAVTPGEFKTKGSGLNIVYGVHATPFGACLLATTRRGVCGLTFIKNGDRRQAVDLLAQKWPGSRLVANPQATGPLVEQIFALQPARQPLKLLVKGTNFQIKVWSALLQIPPGSLASYSTIASRMNQPTATRAVANAVAQNSIGYLIPCHRVIRKVGAISSYRWGAVRKKAILGWEAGQRLAA